MESASVQFDSLNWHISQLGENVLLLKAKNASSRQVRQSAQHLENLLASSLLDITVGYDSIALFTGTSINDLAAQLQNKNARNAKKLVESDMVKLPICYELGKDIESVAEYAKLSRETIIELHLGGVYEVAIIGFLPGFVYAEGLEPKLFCPRKEVPEKKVPAGSVGIGGSQTGIYSFESPGGWNIIGRTPITVFKSDTIPPITLPVGSSFSFFRISIEEFKAWGK